MTVCIVIFTAAPRRTSSRPALYLLIMLPTHYTTLSSQIPVFVWAPEEEGQFQPGRCSRWWIKHSVAALEAQLTSLGSRLVIRRSHDSAAALLQLAAETGARALYFNHLYDPISLVRRRAGPARLRVHDNMYNACCRTYTCGHARPFATV